MGSIFKKAKIGCFFKAAKKPIYKVRIECVFKAGRKSICKVAMRCIFKTRIECTLVLKNKVMLKSEKDTGRKKMTSIVVLERCALIERINYF